MLQKLKKGSKGKAFFGNHLKMTLTSLFWNIQRLKFDCFGHPHYWNKRKKVEKKQITFHFLCSQESLNLMQWNTSWKTFGCFSISTGHIMQWTIPIDLHFTDWPFPRGCSFQSRKAPQKPEICCVVSEKQNLKTRITEFATLRGWNIHKQGLKGKWHEVKNGDRETFGWVSNKEPIFCCWETIELIKHEFMTIEIWTHLLLGEAVRHFGCGPKKQEH